MTLEDLSECFPRERSNQDILYSVFALRVKGLVTKPYAHALVNQASNSPRLPSPTRKADPTKLF